MSDNIDQATQRFVIFFNNPEVKRVAFWILVGAAVAAFISFVTGFIKHLFSSEEEVILTVDYGNSGPGMIVYMLIVIILVLMAALGVQIYRNHGQNLGLDNLLDLIRNRLNQRPGAGDRMEE